MHDRITRTRSIRDIRERVSARYALSNHADIAGRGPFRAQRLRNHRISSVTKSYRRPGPFVPRAQPARSIIHFSSHVTALRARKRIYIFRKLSALQRDNHTDDGCSRNCSLASTRNQSATIRRPDGSRFSPPAFPGQLSNRELSVIVDNVPRNRYNAPRSTLSVFPDDFVHSPGVAGANYCRYRA